VTIWRSFDFETTGTPSETERHAVCEVGWTDVVVKENAEPFVLEPIGHLCNPGRPMPIAARAVHHISDSDVAGKPSPDRIFMALAAGADGYVAHVLDFEREFFTGGERPMICTYKSSLRVWPDADEHKVQYLRYYLKLDEDPDFDPSLAMPPHRARPDSYVTAFIFARLLKLATVEQMIRWSSGPALLVTCYLKAHKGKKWSEVPPSYLQYILDNFDAKDRDIRATARYYLNKSRESTGQPQPANDGGTSHG
jgi:exodeoxyribonuclease X